MNLVMARAEYIEKVAFVRVSTGELGGGRHHMLQSGDKIGFV